MTIILPRPAFLAAFKSAAAAADPRPTSPILGMVYVALQDRRLTLSGQTQATRIDVTIPADCAGVDSFCVAPAALLAALGKVSGPDVTISHDAEKGRVAVACGSAHYNLHTMPGADYPVSPAIPDEVSVTMPALALAGILGRVTISVAPDGNKYGLGGIHMERIVGESGPALRLVSTDGNRLTYDEAPAVIVGKLPGKLLIPSAAVKLILAALAGVTGDVAFVIGDRAARLTLPGAVLTMRLLEADFPDYRQVLPTGHKRLALLLRDELAGAVQAVAPMASDSSHSVSMTFDADGLTLKARKLDTGDALTTCGMDLTGEPMTMGINSTFVLQALAGAPGDKVTWRMGDALSPVVMTVDGCAATWVLMPVRLD